MLIRCRNQVLQLLGVLLLLSLSVVSAAPPEGYSFLPLTEAVSKAKNERKPMLLCFGRYGCSSCLRMHAEVFTDSTVQAKYQEHFVLAYVDTESGNRIRLDNGERITEMQFAARSRVLGTPTFIFFSPEQKPLFKKTGVQSIEQMNHYSDFIVSANYQSMVLEDYLNAQ